MTISKETVEEMKLATKADEPTEKHDGVNLFHAPGHIGTECRLIPGNIQRCIKINLNEINKLYTTLRIQFETIEHKGKEYKVADILDGLAALAKNANKGLNND